MPREAPVMKRVLPARVLSARVLSLLMVSPPEVAG
jgi:hypothetical protein